MPHFDPAVWINLGINFVLPAAVAFITAQNASPAIKSAVLLALSMVSGVLTDWSAASSAGLPFDWQSAATAVVQGFAVAVIAHYGVTKPIGLTGSSGVIAQRLPGGLGRKKTRRPRETVVIQRGRHEVHDVAEVDES